jgi:ribosome-binding factor A
MQEVRRRRLEAAILEELATVVPREVKDPRVSSLTFTAVQLTEEADQATVFFSLLGGRGEMPEAEAKKRVQDCLAGLSSASGFLRRHLAKVLTVRHIPALAFREDRGFENAQRVHELLKQLNTPKAPNTED